MPIQLTAYRVPVTSTPIKLLDCSGGFGLFAYIRNAGGANVFIGGSDVDAATGFELPPNTTIGPVQGWPDGGDLWAVKSGTGTVSVHVLPQQRW